MIKFRVNYPTDYNKAMVPPSCCVRNQYDELVDKEKCQTHKTGPPETNSGQANEALNYRVSMLWMCVTPQMYHGIRIVLYVAFP